MPKSHGKVVPALLGIIRRKSQLLYEHSLLVGELARASALAIGMSDEEVDVVARAGFLHDLGKIAVRQEVLMKPDRLKKHEWRQMKQHPHNAAKALNKMPNMGRVAVVILHHHESGDGEGYPLNIKNELIPVEAKIIRACDVFSAMIVERPYRPSRHPFEYAAKVALDGIGLHRNVEAHISNVFEAYKERAEREVKAKEE